MPKTVKISTEVYCVLQVEGSHFWTECPFEEVFYLRNLHRHVFHIKANKKVTHDDRDVEFIMLKHEIEAWLYDMYFDEAIRLLNFRGMSCEMIAKKLITKFNLTKCEVSEDGENGAIVSVTGIVTDGDPINP